MQLAMDILSILSTDHMRQHLRVDAAYAIVACATSRDEKEFLMKSFSSRSLVTMKHSLQSVQKSSSTLDWTLLVT
jgi:hypothetical protein